LPNLGCRRNGVYTTVVLGKQHDELVAAVSASRIGCPDASEESRGKLLQDAIGNSVSERVVNTFEPVNVDEKERDVIAQSIASSNRQDVAIFE
jgi:hypothetical protein